MQVNGNLVDNELLDIGGQPIRWSRKLKAVRSSFCRAAKKPTNAKWLLGDEYEMEIDIEYKGVQPRVAWRMSDKIQRWEITWRDSTPTNPDVSLGINGDLGSAIMMSHGMTLLALSEVQDKLFLFALVAFVAVHLIRPGDGDDDYVAVVLDVTMCHMELCDTHVAVFVAKSHSEEPSSGAGILSGGLAHPVCALSWGELAGP